MKRAISIIAVIISITVAFFAGSYHGYSNSPGIKGFRILKDLGMTDDEIVESTSNIYHNTEGFLKTLHADNLTGAIMGVNTLKALKDDDSTQVENLAIMQITSYYNAHGSTSDDELEIKLQKEIQMLALDFPELKAKITPSKNE